MDVDQWNNLKDTTPITAQTTSEGTPDDDSPRDLWCLLEGDALILVSVAANKPIAVLKDLIHAKGKSSAYAKDLVLWKVDIPFEEHTDDDILRRLKLTENEGRVINSARQRVSYYWPTQPADDILHIFVPASATSECKLLLLPASSSSPSLSTRSLPFVSPILWLHPVTSPNVLALVSAGMNLLRDVSTPKMGGQSSFTNVLQHTPEKGKKEFQDSIQVFLNDCRPAMETLVSKAGDIPSFMPSWMPGLSMDSDPDLSDHILRLNIPRDKGGLPSLLLHDLGEEKSDLDKLRASRIPGIFSNMHNTLLINTPGSGKSRILLEGLCRHWGFYFVATGSPTIGSSDFYATFSTIDAARDYRQARHLKSIDPLAFPHMEHTTERRLLQLLLARLLLLNHFIEVAKCSRTGLQLKEHRRLWTLLQVHPDIIKGHFYGDIFADLTARLHDTTSETLKDLVKEAHTKLCHLLSAPEGELTLFNVLDEVQEALTLCMGDYKSNDQTTPRPLLRETYRVWSIILGSKFPLILSGTGINYRVIDEILGSSHVKARPYARLHDIGAFDDPCSQAAYIQHYFPPTLFRSSAWKAFLSRAWVWLRGRYRTTAALILLLMQGGYKSPHRTINIYVTTLTAFKPNDGVHWVKTEPSFPADIEVERILGDGPHFEKMSSPQLSMLADVVFTQFVYGSYSLSSIDSPYRAAFVQYGFARHRTGTRAEVIDEPLMIFAALTWLKKQKHFSLLDCLRRDIHMHSTRRNGFEAYLAYYIREIFETPQKLDAVFTFRSDFASQTNLSWQHSAFELVTVSRAKVSPITRNSGPSSSIGFIAVSGMEVLEWIKTNEDKYSFCFPPESFGPDILFYLRCQHSRKLLLVAVQCRKYEEVALDCLVHGLRTVSPPWFWRSKNVKHQNATSAPFVKNDPDCPALAEETPKVLAKILSPLSTGADYAILRVFASWPGDPGLERSLQWTKVTRKQKQGKQTKTSEQEDSSELDPDRHPAATLNLENFVMISQQYDSAWFLGKAEIMVGLESNLRLVGHEHTLRPRKRKLCDEVDDAGS